MDRAAALEARPCAVSSLTRTAQPDGGVRVRVEHQPGPWQRWLLRLPGPLLREYDLDPLGTAVLDACDGRTPVRRIIADFAQTQQVSEAEAERAVSLFLRTLLQRQIIVMAVPEPRRG